MLPRPSLEPLFLLVSFPNALYAHLTWQQLWVMRQCVHAAGVAFSFSHLPFPFSLALPILSRLAQRWLQQDPPLSGTYSLGLSFGFNILLRNHPSASHPPSPCSFPLLVRGLCDGTVRVEFGVGSGRRTTAAASKIRARLGACLPKRRQAGGPGRAT
ncbi:hypothetical protein BC567DRAFT_61238 [Phyllosticta citribraziliensis]